MNYWKRKKVIITGVGGFIGRHVADNLVARGAIVTGILSPKSDEKTIRNRIANDKEISFVRADLLSPKAVNAAISEHDIVLNFAALDGGTKFKQEHAAEIFRINTQITTNVLEAARLYNIERVLLISSTEVYKVLKLTNEKSILDPNMNDGYAWSKRFGEIAAKLYAEQYGLKIAVARLGNVYGPGDHRDKGRVIPLFISQALHNESIHIWGEDTKRAFLYVSDAVEALLQLVEEYPTADPVPVIGDNNVPLNTIAENIISFSKSSSNIIIEQASSSEQRKISSAKLKRLLKFREKMKLEKGLQITLNSFS